MTVVIGIDAHKASHTATAIGPGSVEAATIRLRAARSTPEELLSWAAQWPERRWGVEGAPRPGPAAGPATSSPPASTLSMCPRPSRRGCGPSTRDTAAQDRPHRRPRGRARRRSAPPDLPRVTADDHCRVLRLLADRRDELTSERRRTINRLPPTPARPDRRRSAHPAQRQGSRRPAR